MKICVISPLFDPFIVGGAEKFAKQLVDELSKKHQVIVITTAAGKVQNRKTEKNNLKIIEVKPTNLGTLYEMITNDSVFGLRKIFWHLFNLWNYSSYTKIKYILKKEKPDLVHTNGIKGFSPSLFSVIKNLQIPHVHSLNDYELISPWVVLFRKGKLVTKFNALERLYKYYLRNISSSIDAVISPSRFVMDFHERLGFFVNSKKYVIPHGTNIRKTVLPKQGMVKEFLFLGQIIENKGPQIAIEAFRKIERQDIKLHVVGKGPYLNKLKKLTRGDARIIFHGYVKDEDLDLIFDKCSCMLVPSLWYEVYGMVIPEVMSRGLPVIASKIGAIPELVKDGYNGFLFEAGNVDSLNKKMNSLINDEKILPTLSKNAIDFSKNLTIPNQLEKILKVYRLIL